jgi:hypothetical protein
MDLKIACLLVDGFSNPLGLKLNGLQADREIRYSGIEQIIVIVQATRDAFVTQEVALLLEFLELTDQCRVIALFPECFYEPSRPVLGSLRGLSRVNVSAEMSTVTGETMR